MAPHPCLNLNESPPSESLVRMVNKAGSTYTEEQLEAGGTWSPKQIYCMKNYSDILGVDSELVDI